MCGVLQWINGRIWKFAVPPYRIMMGFETCDKAEK